MSVTLTRAKVQQLEELGEQIAVHRRKFEFALSQVRHLSNYFTEEISSETYNKVMNYLDDLMDLILECLLKTWSALTIENSSGFILGQLHSVFTNLKGVAIQFGSEADTCINPDSPEWVEYHLLDLQAIAASFNQCLKNTNLEKHLAEAITLRLRSIEQNLSENDVGSRVFSPIPVNYQNWRVDINNFRLVERIGTGVSSDVYKGTNNLNGEIVAIKQFKAKTLIGSRLQSFQREVAAMAIASHPCLLKLIGATDVSPFCIIMEWMPNQSLYHDLHYNKKLDPTMKTLAAFDIARGMQFLHSCHIVHRDLKSLNILLDANLRIRICDFGFSRHAADDSMMTQNIGTPHWMAPELLQTGSNYTNKVDVYAFGIVLWEIATSQTPYQGLDSQQVIGKVILNDLRPTLPSTINPAMKDLITQCWDRDPELRPTFDEIVKRMQTGEVVFNDCSKDDFLMHVEMDATKSEALIRDIEQMVYQKLRGEITLGELTQRLKSTSIPPDSIEIVWNSLRETDDPKDFPSFLSLFRRTSKRAESISLLKEIPAGQISQDVLIEYVYEIPTGCEEIDSDIVLVACNNGLADHCIVYGSKEKDLMRAMKVALKTGVDTQLRVAVIDKCVLVMENSNIDLVIAATNLLLSLRAFTRIPQQVMIQLLQSNEEEVKRLAYVSLAASAIHSIQFNSEVLQRILPQMQGDHRAALVAICASTKEASAKEVLNYLNDNLFETTEDLIKLLLQIFKHEALRAQVISIAKRASEPSDERLQAILRTLRGQLVTNT